MNSYGKKDTTIKVAYGEKFIITLETVSTAGYLWRYDIEDTTTITLSEEELLIHTTDLGASTYTQFTFQSLKKGDTHITMEYLRPWEESPEEQIRFSIQVT